MSSEPSAIQLGRRRRMNVVCFVVTWFNCGELFIKNAFDIYSSEDLSGKIQNPFFNIHATIISSFHS